MKIILKSLLVFGIFLSSLIAGDLPVKNQDVSPQQLQKQNKEIAQLVATELSKTLPKKIDKYTILNSVKAKDSNLIYTFEINTGAKSDETVRKEDKTRMKTAITNGVCRSSKRFMDAQVVITYLYISSTSKEELFRFDIKQSDCPRAY